MSQSVSSRSSSPHSPQSSASSVLTPRRKVQALLAQFDDSDSENDPVAEKPAKTNHSIKSVNTIEQDEETEEDDIIPRSRLTARLMGNTTAHENGDRADSKDNGSNQAHEPVLSSPITNARTASLTSSEDELNTAAPTRRLLNKRKGSPVNQIESPKRRARSASPLFFSSPASNAARGTPSPAKDQSAGNGSVSAHPASDGRERFLALVAKQRKQRIEREAAEIAKRAAGNDNSSGKQKKRGQRGSSPADDTDEDSGSADEEAAKKISKQAPPTRKASKKALEEMHRETQRMSRNMQLAHEARTKTKITKESLLARFNFLPNIASASHKVASKSSGASSSVQSGDESDKEITTPPTSPLEEPHEIRKKQVSLTADTLGQYEMHGALLSDDDLPDAMDILSQTSQQRGEIFRLKYVANNKTVLSPKPKESVPLPVSSLPAVAPLHFTEVRNAQTRFARIVKPVSANSESDSDLDIVTDHGSKRKYAAFESLAKKKAIEKPSHLALRSLAHIISGEDKKKSMNAAEMESSLRRAARLQAFEERKQKIAELKAKGVIIQSAEERERDQQEVEDLVERARQEAVEIQKREKELAKKDGTYVKDGLDDDEDDSDDEDFEEEDDADEAMDSAEDSEDENQGVDKEGMIDDEVEEADSEDEEAEQAEIDEEDGNDENPEVEDAVEQDVTSNIPVSATSTHQVSRRKIVVSDDEDDHVQDNTPQQADPSPKLPGPMKTPQSVLRSAKKMIPGLQMSDDLPMGLSQAFAATMAESQFEDHDEAEGQDSLDLTAELPAPRFAPVPSLSRLDSIDIVSDSLPATQTQPLNVDLSCSQLQTVPDSPARGLGIMGTQVTASQVLPFDLTQDAGYLLSPFTGSRFAETPKQDLLHSTIDTVILPTNIDDSPVVQRKSRLQRGRIVEEDDTIDTQPENAFQAMKHAAKRSAEAVFDKSKSNARAHFDEAAEESEDEYAGLGGASDDDGVDEENEDDRRMIDEDTQVGKGDEAKLAGLYADRERERDEKEVSKLLKDITTGALRRKRGIGDDLDLSDEEDEAARRREAKRREFAKMRRELLKDEAVGKIAEDRKKEAFLRSIEDRDAVEDDDDDDDDNELEQLDTQQTESQSQSQNVELIENNQGESQSGQKRKRPLESAVDSQLNRLPPSLRRTQQSFNKKPATLAEIRDSVSFLIDEPDSQAATVDLGLSDSEDDEEAYVNLDRHLQDVENDENALDDDAEDLGDFIVDDEPFQTRQDSQDDNTFKKPNLPTSKSTDRAPFSQRRTQRAEVIDRLSLLRQQSSATNSITSTTTLPSNNNKMAFYATSKNPSTTSFTTPSLLRRATTNSSLGSVAGISSTGVTIRNDTSSKTERGNAANEKEFIRKGRNTGRNAVNFQARNNTSLREEKMAERNKGGRGRGLLRKLKGGNIGNNGNGSGNGKGGFLGGLLRGDSWE